MLERELPPAGSLTRWPQQPVQSQGQPEPQLLPGLPHGYPAPKHLDHLALCFVGNEQGAKPKAELLGHELALIGMLASSAVTLPISPQC